MTEFSSAVITAGLAAATAGIVGSQLTRWLATPTDGRKISKAVASGRPVRLEEIPGPPGVLLVGNLFEASQYTRGRRTDLFFVSTLEKYGSKGLAKIEMLGRPIILTSDPVLAKRILNTPAVFDRSTSFLTAVAGVSEYMLFTLPEHHGSVWKKHRKGLQPVFGGLHLREAFTASLEMANILVEQYVSRVERGDDQWDVHSSVQGLTMDVIAKVAFSADFGFVKSMENGKKPTLFEDVEKVVSAFEYRSRFPQSWMWDLGKMGIEDLRPHVSRIRDMLVDTINQKKEYLEQNPDKLKGNSDLWSRDVLDRMLIAGHTENGVDESKRFSDDEIIGEVIGFFLAGSDTTANTLSFSIMELVQNPRVQQKLQEELDNLLHGEPPTFENVHTLRYLDSFVKEILRIHPVVPLDVRIAVTDTVQTLSDGTAVEVKEGTRVAFSMYLLHTNPAIWGDDAKEFKPERWLVGNGLVPSPGSYMPFGDGQMACIGQKMALIEIKVVLIRILQHFSVSASSMQGSAEQVFTVTLGLKNGYHVKFSLRNAKVDG